MPCEMLRKRFEIDIVKTQPRQDVPVRASLDLSMEWNEVPKWKRNAGYPADVIQSGLFRNRRRLEVEK